VKVSNLIRLSVAILVVLLNIGCDQVSKSMAREHLEIHESVSMADGHFTLIKVENTGAFLSLGQDWSPVLKQILLLGLPLACLLITFAFLLSKPRLPAAIMVGLGSIIGGGIGNIYDRLVYGSVTDFMHIDLGFVQTGVFNMADVSIMIGTGLVVFYSLFTKPKEGL
jgi:signal peptidase II